MDLVLLPGDKPRLERMELFRRHRIHQPSPLLVDARQRGGNGRAGCGPTPHLAEALPLVIEPRGGSLDRRLPRVFAADLLHHGLRGRHGTAAHRPHVICDWSRVDLDDRQLDARVPKPFLEIAVANRQIEAGETEVGCILNNPGEQDDRRRSLLIFETDRRRAQK